MDMLICSAGANHRKVGLTMRSWYDIRPTLGSWSFDAPNIIDIFCDLTTTEVELLRTTLRQISSLASSSQVNGLTLVRNASLRLSLVYTLLLSYLEWYNTFECSEGDGGSWLDQVLLPSTEADIGLSLLCGVPWSKLSESGLEQWVKQLGRGPPPSYMSCMMQVLCILLEDPEAPDSLIESDDWYGRVSVLVSNPSFIHQCQELDRGRVTQDAFKRLHPLLRMLSRYSSTLARGGVVVSCLWQWILEVTSSYTLPDQHHIECKLCRCDSNQSVLVV